jgi:hypothetical protein
MRQDALARCNNVAEVFRKSAREIGIESDCVFFMNVSLIFVAAESLHRIVEVKAASNILV